MPDRPVLGLGRLLGQADLAGAEDAPLGELKQVAMVVSDRRAADVARLLGVRAHAWRLTPRLGSDPTLGV